MLPIYNRYIHLSLVIGLHAQICPIKLVTIWDSDLWVDLNYLVLFLLINS